MNLPSEYAGSDATRLMCAGVYLDPAFRAGVIQVLATDDWRAAAPSYGYDAVPVLAHALVARGLRRVEVALLLIGALAISMLLLDGVVGLLGMLALYLWLVWAVSVLRRLATLQNLVTHVRSADGVQRVATRLPDSVALTPELVRKISQEQVSGDGVVYYGGYKPFVGAGTGIRSWSNAQLLIEAPLPPLIAPRPPSVPPSVSLPPVDPFSRPRRVTGEWGRDLEPATGGVVPFTVADITDFVARRLVRDLRDEAPPAERIRELTVERRKFTKATATVAADLSYTPKHPQAIHWQETYGAAREYLCVRVGSWNQELVTSMFVGFDLKGNTLHTEFHTYVLPPIEAGYHLVDRLPARLDDAVPFMVAWDALKSMFSSVPVLRRPRIRTGTSQTDESELGLARYGLKLVDRGALVSIRELAASDTFLHFFQNQDAVKYMKIVERRLLAAIEAFLRDHGVDLSDHHAIQNTILNGDVNTHYGAGNQSVRNSGTQSVGTHSTVTVGSPAK